MKDGFPFNVSPNIFTISGALAGALLTSDFDDYELNAIGNWIILVGQYLLTYASQMQLIEAKIDGNNININSKQYKNGGSPYTNNKASNQTQRMEVDYLLEALKKMQKELEELKKNVK